MTTFIPSKHGSQAQSIDRKQLHASLKNAGTLRDNSVAFDASTIPHAPERFVYQNAGIIYDLQRKLTAPMIMGVTSIPREYMRYRQLFASTTGHATYYGDIEQCPQSDYELSRFESGCVSYHAGFYHTATERERAAVTGYDPVMLKERAAKEALLTIQNRIAFFGIEGVGSDVYGLFNHPALLPVQNVAPGTSGKTDWADKTGAEIKTDILTQLMTFTSERGLRFKDLKTLPLLLLLPSSQYQDFMTRDWNLTGCSDQTIGLWFMQNFPNMTVEEVPELEDAAAPGVDMGILMIESLAGYDNLSDDDKSTIKNVVAIALERLPDDLLHNQQQTIARYRTKDFGTIVNRPFAIVRFSGI
jgi:hypothetical protein